MMRPVFIRVDGNLKIGLGHIVRCLALAKMLKEEFSISFFSKDLVPKMENQIKGEGFSFYKILNEEEFLDILSGNEIVVLDNYQLLSTNFQKKIKHLGCKLVCIDDLCEGKFVADLIINHAPGTKKENYNYQPYTNFALGLNHAMLRSSFLEAAKKPRNIEKIETVFICFGGSDSKNVTKKVLEAVLEFNNFKKIIVVLGTAYPYRDSLIEFSGLSQLEIYIALEEQEMLEKMESSQIAIVPSSGILLETIAAGCLPLICFYAENQKKIFDYLVQEKDFNHFNALPFNKRQFFDSLSALILTSNHSMFSLRKYISFAPQNLYSAFKKLK